MKWKELMTRKRLLFSLVAVATIATIFVLYATMHTITTPRSAGTSISDSPILLANNDYPKHDLDFQAVESQVSVGGGPESIASDRSSGDPNKPSTSEPQTSHTPEPSSMLLLGSALFSLAVFRRKLRKP